MQPAAYSAMLDVAGDGVFQRYAVIDLVDLDMDCPGRAPGPVAPIIPFQDELVAVCIKMEPIPALAP